MPQDGDSYTPDLLTPQPGTDAQCRDLIDEQIARIEAAAQDDLENQVFTYTRTHWSRPLRATTRRIAESGRMQRRLANGLARFWRDTLSDGRPELRSIGQFVLYYPAQRIGSSQDRRSGNISQVVGNARAALRRTSRSPGPPQNSPPGTDTPRAPSPTQVSYRV